MSDEMAPRDASAGATLTCDAGIAPERLSAWRDGLAPAEEAEWLATHAAGCPACSMRLRDYDQIGAALRGQAIPRPATDSWPAMQRLIARERRGWRRLPQRSAWGGLGALVAAALLIALFAGLLAHQASLRPTVDLTPTVARAAATATTATTPTASPTATTIPAGAWTEVDAYSGLRLALAPSDPRIAYQMAQNTDGTSTLQRTSDQGAHWQQLAAPILADGSAATGVLDVFVSPLDANRVYVIVGAQESACGPNGVTQNGYCNLEYVSADGGSHWQPLRLPTMGLLTSMLVGQGAPAEWIAGDIRAQGTRLYGDVVNMRLGQEYAPPPGRLVVSDDGGESWRLADAQIHNAGQGIFDYAPTASGATIFVASAPLGNVNTGPISSLPTMTLWRSDNAGASWIKLGRAPNNSVDAMRAAIIGGSGKPILYVMTVDNAGRTIQGSLYGASGNFTLAPGFSDEAPGTEGPALLTTLADGSLVVDDNGSIESWLPTRDAKHWQPIGQPDGMVSFYSAFTRTQPDGATALWLVGQSLSNQFVEYATLPK